VGSIDPAFGVDPLSNEIAVTDKDLLVDSKSVKSMESKDMSINFDVSQDPGRYEQTLKSGFPLVHFLATGIA